MDVVLPTTGCNVLNSATTFYNYSPDSRTRSTYIIFDGEAHLQSTMYNQSGFNYTGDCLTTGDLVYKPEYKEFVMPFCSFIAFAFILGFIYKIFIRGLMR